MRSGRELNSIANKQSSKLLPKIVLNIEHSVDQVKKHLQIVYLLKVIQDFIPEEVKFPAIL